MTLETETKYRISTSSRESMDRWRGEVTHGMKLLLSELESVLSGGAFYHADVSAQLLERMMPHIDGFDASACLPSPACNTNGGAWGMDCYCARKRLEDDASAAHIQQLHLVPSQNQCTIRISRNAGGWTEYRNTIIKSVGRDGMVQFIGRPKGCRKMRCGVVEARRIVFYGKEQT